MSETTTTTAQAIPDSLARLASELGIDAAGIDDETKKTLELLADDELEQLAPDAFGRFKEKARAAAKVVITCKGCGTWTLPRFKSEDATCRSCGAALETGKRGVAGAGSTEAGAAAVSALFRGIVGRATGAVKTHATFDDAIPARGGPALEAVIAEPDLKKKVDLGDEEDWDVREEKILGEAEKLKREEEERRRLEEEEQRLAIGVLIGAKAGQVIRIADLDPKSPPTGMAPIAFMEGKVAKLKIPAGAEVLVNEKAAKGTVELPGGTLVRGLVDPDDLCVIEENGELHAVNADPVHLQRADGKPGGPWPYWNEAVTIGSAGAEILVADDEVAAKHARMSTVFGRVLIEDLTEEEGVWIGGERVKNAIVKPGTELSLSENGPKLKVVAGQAETKMVKAAAMKPARYVRTVLHIEDGQGKRKAFLFARREVRFGRLGSKDGEKLENELVLLPYDDTQAIGDKMGSFALSRDAMTIRLDDRKVAMAFDEKPMKPGENIVLPRRFELDIGDGGLLLKGQVYRSPSHVERPASHGQLGVEGGHPFECVRLERTDGVEHTFIFLVRQVRLGSGPSDGVQLSGATPGHAMLLMAKGTFQIVAPKGNVTVEDDEVHELTPGEPIPLKIGATIKIADATLRFDVTAEEDFRVHEVEETAAE